jgi:hypothetical protein
LAVRGGFSHVLLALFAFDGFNQAQHEVHGGNTDHDDLVSAYGHHLPFPIFCESAGVQLRVFTPCLPPDCSNGKFIIQDHL